MRISFLNTVACADMVFHIGLQKRDLTRKKSIDLKVNGKFLDQTAAFASKFGPVVIFLTQHRELHVSFKNGLRAT